MEPNTKPDLVVPTALQLLLPEGAGAVIDAELHYSSTDPYAVSLVIAAAPEPIVWLFARELLAEGLVGPAGDGDVHVWPDRDDDGQPMVVLELIAGEAAVLLAARPCDIATFVTRSHDQVPPGAESEHCDVDRIINGLLAGAPGAGHGA